MRIHFARHFTTPRHYVGVVAVQNKIVYGDGSDDWAAYIEAMPIAMAEAGPSAATLTTPAEIAGFAELAARWGAKLTEEDARYFFPADRFPQLAGVPYRD